MFCIRIECLLWRKHYNRCNIAVREGYERRFPEVTPYLRERTDQALEITDTVTDRQIRQAVSEITELFVT